MASRCEEIDLRKCWIEANRFDIESNCLDQKFFKTLGTKLIPEESGDQHPSIDRL